jgi:beta-alanine--pyruvate transaminase
VTRRRRRAVRRPPRCGWPLLRLREDLEHGALSSAIRRPAQADVTCYHFLTNGAIPMGAVAAKEKVYRTITEAAPDKAIEFFHGYTYTAHPAACAAGIAALEIYEGEGLFERAKALEAHFLDAVFALRDIPVVTDIRGIGLLAGIDLAPDVKPGVRG